jgi:hypothetical protein
MRKLREWILQCGGLFNKRRRDRELDEEIESHLQMHIEDNVRSGMTPEEARRHAMIKLGGIDSTKEAYRDQRGFAWLGGLALDFKLAARLMAKYPWLTVVGVAGMSFGMAAGVGGFELMTQVINPSLPFDEAPRIIGIRNWDACGIGLL